MTNYLCRRKNTEFIHLFLFSLFTSGVYVSSFAQKLPTIAEVRTWGLASNESKITAYFSNEYKHKIAQVRPLAEQMLSFYKKTLNIQDSIKIVMLNRSQWKQYLSNYPYGLVLVMNHIAFIPATPDGVLNQGTLELKDSVSAGTIKKIKKSGYTFQDAAEKYTELILLHELGHSFTQEFGINTMNNPMLNEFMASYFAYAYLAKKHPKMALLFEAMVTDVYIDAYRPKYTSLSDFERLYLKVGADNYSWYQAQFLKKGIEIYKDQKLTFLTAMKKMFPINKKERLTSEAILEKLIILDPQFSSWNLGF